MPYHTCIVGIACVKSVSEPAYKCSRMSAYVLRIGWIFPQMLAGKQLLLACGFTLMKSFGICIAWVFMLYSRDAQKHTVHVCGYHVHVDSNLFSMKAAYRFYISACINMRIWCCVLECRHFDSICAFIQHPKKFKQHDSFRLCQGVLMLKNKSARDFHLVIFMSHVRTHLHTQAHPRESLLYKCWIWEKLVKECIIEWIDNVKADGAHGNPPRPLDWGKMKRIVDFNTNEILSPYTRTQQSSGDIGHVQGSERITERWSGWQLKPWRRMGCVVQKKKPTGCACRELRGNSHENLWRFWGGRARADMRCMSSVGRRPARTVWRAILVIVLPCISSATDQGDTAGTLRNMNTTHCVGQCCPCLAIVGISLDCTLKVLRGLTVHVLFIQDIGDGSQSLYIEGVVTQRILVCRGSLVVLIHHVTHVPCEDNACVKCTKMKKHEKRYIMHYL